jgi:hypothetical protein
MILLIEEALLTIHLKVDMIKVKTMEIIIMRCIIRNHMRTTMLIVEVEEIIASSMDNTKIMMMKKMTTMRSKEIIID